MSKIFKMSDLKKLLEHVDAEARFMFRDLERTQEELSAFQKDISQLLETSRPIEARKLEKEALFQKREERVLTKKIKFLQRLLFKLKKYLSSFEELQEVYEVFEKQRFLERITLAKKYERAYSSRRGILAQEIEKHFLEEEYQKEYEELIREDPHEVENAKKDLEAHRGRVLRSLEKLTKLHGFLSRLIGDLRQFIDEVVHERIKLLRVLDLDVGFADDVLIDTNTIRFIAELLEKKKYVNVRLKGRYKRVIIPKSVKKESLRSNARGQVLVSNKMFSKIKDALRAEVKHLHLDDEEADLMVRTWFRYRRIAKGESENHFRKTADIRIMAYAYRHYNCVILARDEDISTAMKHEPTLFHRNKVLALQGDRLREA